MNIYIYIIVLVKFITEKNKILQSIPGLPVWTNNASE